MPGIDPRVMSHSLSVEKEAKPVVQRRRCFNVERNAAIKEEVKKLLAAGSIREATYPKWIVNVVLVEKKNDG